MPTYDLNSVQLPKLQGAALRAFAAALRFPLTNALLIPNLLRQGGFNRFRALQLDEPPTYTPLVAAADPATTPMSPAEAEAALGPHVPGAIFVTVRDYAAAYRSGKTTPEEIARRVLDAIRQSDAGEQPLRAFIASKADDVLAQGRAATARLAAGKPLSLLDGVPVAIKDEVDQTPYPTTVGTAFLGRRPATEDATAVARLRAAGALLIGKANMHEIGINPNGANVHYGPARNPYDPAHDCGGSSSGPAVAVAAGLCPVALGADGGGSIRIPASLCGLVGLKPTYGRVSEHGAAPLCWSVAHLGPIGATVEDVALAYALMAGPDPRDPNSLRQPAVSLAGWNRPDLTGLTLGVCRAWFEHATPDIVAACRAAVERLQQAGAEVREVEIPELDAMRLAHIVTILSEMATSLADHRDELHRLGPSVQSTLALGMRFTAAGLRQGATYEDAGADDLRPRVGRGGCDRHASRRDHCAGHPSHRCGRGLVRSERGHRVDALCLPCQPDRASRAQPAGGLRRGRAAHRGADHGAALGGGDAAADRVCRRAGSGAADTASLLPYLVGLAQWTMSDFVFLRPRPAD